jgi:uncharacterized repeat protein (TIGR04138 family)
MTCFKCGASNPVVHFTGMSDGVQERRAYCKTCFAQSEFADESVAARIEAFESKHRKAELDRNLEQLKRVIGPKLEELVEKEHRFPLEAYYFIFQSLKYALAKDASLPKQCPRHVAARQLVEASEAYAKETYGESAKARLKSWSIETSSDVGDVVFLLVENGFMGKQPDDKQEDFTGLPFLADQT